MKSTTNVFLGGLKTDYHPLTQDQQSLTDALNATLITYNGNEMMLQNDMGNTKILDSTTGNIMGLRDGFVPLGMKEHGGILYIASYNLNTKEGELGTIPSPLFNYTYNTSPKVKTYSRPVMSGHLENYNENASLIDDVQKYKLLTENPYNISDSRFHVGDQFLFSLDIKEINYRTSRKVLIGTTVPTSESEFYYIDFPYITLVSSIFSYDINTLQTLYQGPGWFKLELLSKASSSENVVKLDDVLKKQANWWTDSYGATLNQSLYWFIDLDISKIDVEHTLSDYRYLNYPNIEPGYLWVKLEPEIPHTFTLDTVTVHVVFQLAENIQGPIPPPGLD